MSSNGGGDQLARGAVRAQFKPANISQKEWDEIFDEAEKKLSQMSEEDRERLFAEDAELQRKLEEENSRPVGEVRIRAIQDRIVVRRVEAETVTSNGLFLADESKEKPAEGIVVATGPGKLVEGKLLPPSIYVGERVVFGKYSGAEVKIGLEMLVILREEDIYLVKEAPALQAPVVSVQPEISFTSQGASAIQMNEVVQNPDKLF
jgi:chaperonin GroES